MPFGGGDALAIFEFGRGIEDSAVHARDFHAHVAERSGHGDGLAGQGASLCGVGAHADGGGLAEEQVDQLLGVRGVTQQGD